MLALTDAPLASHHVARVPTAVIAQVWRASPRQHAVARLLKARAATDHPLSEAVGYQLGCPACDKRNLGCRRCTRRSSGSVVQCGGDHLGRGDIQMIDPYVEVQQI